MTISNTLNLFFIYKFKKEAMGKEGDKQRDAARGDLKGKKWDVVDKVAEWGCQVATWSLNSFQ